MACQFCAHGHSCNPYVQRLQKSSVRHDEQICSIGTSELPLPEKIGKIQRHLCTKSLVCNRHRTSSAEPPHPAKVNLWIPQLQRSIFVATPLKKYRLRELLKSFFVYFVS